MRVGMGYDVHKLVENRKLILGGVEIPYEYGLLGHSDADVLVHAIMDALLGAAALRDIGRHFPDNDPAYEGADSIELLKKVGEMLEEHRHVRPFVACQTGPGLHRLLHRRRHHRRPGLYHHGHALSLGHLRHLLYLQHRQLPVASVSGRREVL